MEAILSDVRRYVVSHACRSLQDFVSNLLADIRHDGTHMDWYRLLFSDSEFMDRVSTICICRGIDSFWLQDVGMRSCDFDGDILNVVMI